MHTFAYYLTPAFVLSSALFSSFVPLPFINCITGTELKPLKLLAHTLCFSAFIFTFPHLEISVSCLSHCPRISICCVSFKTQFKSQFLQCLKEGITIHPVIKARKLNVILDSSFPFLHCSVDEWCPLRLLGSKLHVGRNYLRTGNLSIWHSTQ